MITLPAMNWGAPSSMFAAPKPPSTLNTTLIDPEVLVNPKKGRAVRRRCCG